MRTVRIAVCDDDENIREHIKQIIYEQWGSQHSTQLFSDGSGLLDYYREGRAPLDIVLMDILMPELDGIQTALRLRKRDRHTIIIFLSSSRDYLLEGYAVHAYQYLLKNHGLVNDSELIGVLSSALDRVQHDEESIVLRTGRELNKVILSSIMYIDVDRKHVRFHSRDGCHLRVYGSLKEHLAMLPERDFKVISAYCVVNLKYIMNISTTQRLLSLTDGTTLTVSRDRISQLSSEFFILNKGASM